MRFTAAALEERGLASERIFVSMERGMSCAIGLCGHCQLRELFICKDGAGVPAGRGGTSAHGARAMKPDRARPTLAVWKFASCDGCQLSILDLEDELLALAGELEIAYFMEASRATVAGPYDVSLVEGSVTTRRMPGASRSCVSSRGG